MHLVHKDNLLICPYEKKVLFIYMIPIKDKDVPSVTETNTPERLTTIALKAIINTILVFIFEIFIILR